MKRKMKTLLYEVDREAKKREYKRDGHGNIIIPLVVQDDSDFLSVFAETETMQIEFIPLHSQQETVRPSSAAVP